MATTTYRIFAENVGPLADRVQKVNKKAAKLNLSPINMIVTGHEETLADDGVTLERWAIVEIAGEFPRLNGWEFVATLQHDGEGVIIRSVPGAGDLPEAYRSADPGNCDHCHMYRRRNDTFVVRRRQPCDFGGDPDRWFYAQVGRNCLADFVGTDSVAALAQRAEWMSLIHDLAEGFGETRGRRYEDRMLLQEALNWAAEAMLRFGWVPRSKAEAWGRSATVDVALAEMAAKQRKWEPSEQAIALVETVLAWAPEYIERELKRNPENDYIWNMSVVFRGETIAARSYGLAASILACYMREQDRQAKFREQNQDVVSEWIGNVGDKVVLSLTVKGFRLIQGGYQVCTLITYHDDKGRLVKWFASGTHTPTIGETAAFEGTVKEHKEYNGIKETHLTRVKPYLTPEQKKALKQAKKEAKLKYEAAEKAVEEAWEVYKRDGNRDMYDTAQAAARLAYTEWQAL